MKMTLTRKAANLVGHNGCLFNDRLPDGRRSLKVYAGGWLSTNVLRTCFEWLAARSKSNRARSRCPSAD